MGLAYRTLTLIELKDRPAAEVDLSALLKQVSVEKTSNWLQKALVTGRSSRQLW